MISPTSIDTRSWLRRYFASSASNSVKNAVAAAAVRRTSRAVPCTTLSKREAEKGGSA